MMVHLQNATAKEKQNIQSDTYTNNYSRLTGTQQPATKNQTGPL